MELLHKLLMDRYDEIRLEGSSKEKEEKIIEAYDLVREFANVARKEGLLALEECAENLNINNESKELFFSLIMLLVDGTDPEILTEIGINKIIANNLLSYDGLISLIFLRGSLMIQAGANPYLIERYLKSMIPNSCKNILEKREEKNKFVVVEKQAEELIKRLCEDNKEPDKEDYGIVNQTALTFIAISDKSIERLLREIDNTCIAVAMKAMPGKARKRIFDNVSTRLGILLAEDMEFMGPVRLKDAEDACNTILRNFVRLVDYGEIVGFDTSVLKVVLDIYNRAQKRNHEIREQYKDIKKLIEEIYERDC